MIRTWNGNSPAAATSKHIHVFYKKKCNWCPLTHIFDAILSCFASYNLLHRNISYQYRLKVIDQTGVKQTVILIYIMSFLPAVTIDGCCIETKWLCDGFQDCATGVDEERSVCQSTPCNSGRIEPRCTQLANYKIKLSK